MWKERWGYTQTAHMLLTYRVVVDVVGEVVVERRQALKKYKNMTQLPY